MYLKCTKSMWQTDNFIYAYINKYLAYASTSIVYTRYT